MKVWQGKTLVKTSTGFAQATLEGIPAGKTRYTVDLQASRDPKVWRLSPATHTVWQLISPAVVDTNFGDIMPLMQLDYAVDTDLAGYAKGGWQTVGLTASHLPGAVGAAAIAAGSMWVSYNSGTQVPAGCSGQGGQCRSLDGTVQGAEDGLRHHQGPGVRQGRQQRRPDRDEGVRPEVRKRSGSA